MTDRLQALQTTVEPCPETAAGPRTRYAPVLSNVLARTMTGMAIGVLSVVFSAARAHASGLVPVLSTLGLFGTAWLVAVAVTDKYRHKYPYRYYSYLFASHAKAAVIMAFLLGLGIFLSGSYRARSSVLWTAFGWFVLADLAVSIPRRRLPLPAPYDHSLLTSRDVSAQADSSAPAETPAAPPSERPRTFAEIAGTLDDRLVADIRTAVPGFHDGVTAAVIVDPWRRRPGAMAETPVDLLISRVRINDLRHINRFLIAATAGLNMAGHFVCQYEPLEDRRAALAEKHGALFFPAFIAHFAFHRVFPKIPVVNRLYFVLTRGRNRDLSKAEVWGRLSFCGLKVVREIDAGNGRVIAAQRMALPITNKKPSYYPVIALSKVGLDGELLQTHKVRSMYPFSEFLQKQLFEDQGLADSGKFRNDFRLTEYGAYLRRYWVDELPQIYDWLRGDIKLVGMRATSPHFLSLYPREFIDLYIRVKPGLIPPLFDEQTIDGFAHIVRIELDYLQKYVRAPFRTDLALLWDTFRDIVFQGVRSK